MDKRIVLVVAVGLVVADHPAEAGPDVDYGVCVSEAVWNTLKASHPNAEFTRGWSTEVQGRSDRFSFNIRAGYHPIATACGVEMEREHRDVVDRYPTGPKHWCSYDTGCGASDTADGVMTRFAGKFTDAFDDKNYANGARVGMTFIALTQGVQTTYLYGGYYVMMEKN